MNKLKSTRIYLCWLQAVVVVGPFSILKITSKNASPFNVEHGILSPNFSLSQVEDLFQQYETARKLKVDQRIVHDIFNRTDGYP